ncbi:MAG: biotin/lipoyl-binding protein [Planctomycetaceae bacterium]|nr:biotin/lipoyl-binding protein [Planctomycetaceae bacterium]
MKRHYHIQSGGESRSMTVSDDDGSALTIHHGNKGLAQVTLSGNPAQTLRTVTINGVAQTVGVVRMKEGLRLTVGGEMYDVAIGDPRSARYAAVAHTAKISKKQVIKAPMPGMIVKVMVKEGDSVAKGQTLVILNAMKLENDIRAPYDGKISAIHVAADQAVDKNAKLITIE